MLDLSYLLDMRVCVCVCASLWWIRWSLWCPFFTSWEICRLLALQCRLPGNTEADNGEQLQLQRRLNASSSVSVSLLFWKHRVGIWIEELSWFILIFPHLAELLQCLFFHSGALFCPGLDFWLQFSRRFSNPTLKASCSSFGFCCSCHLVHLQDKRKKPTGGLPPFHPLCSPSKGHFFEHKNLLCA